jgi:hypothetical protein
MFYMMLGRFEDMTFLHLMKVIADNVNAAEGADPRNQEEYKEKML